MKRELDSQARVLKECPDAIQGQHSAKGSGPPTETPSFSRTFLSSGYRSNHFLAYCTLIHSALRKFDHEQCMAAEGFFLSRYSCSDNFCQDTNEKIAMSRTT